MKNVFSNRELEIIKEVSKGKSSREISENLGISIHTVNTHRRKVLKKAGVKNSVSLLNFCAEKKIL